MIDRLIKSEDTSQMWDRWGDYRSSVTGYIISAVEHFERKKWLVGNGKLRPDRSFSIRDITDSYLDKKGRKPVLAIWGAGGCNDIDVKLLSDYFRLVLIDRDTEIIEDVRLRLGIDSKECACIDLKFFDVSYEEYQMFDALLQDGCDDAEAADFIQEIKKKMVKYNYSDLRFDYSVAIGLSSQLAARFAAISFCNGRLEGMERHIKELSDFAVSNMLDAVINTTCRMAVIGYEVSEKIIELKDDLRQLEENCNRYNEYIEELFASGRQNEILISEELVSNIEGNNKLLGLLRAAIAGKQIGELIAAEVFDWPFNEEKHYLMNVIALNFRMHQTEV